MKTFDKNEKVKKWRRNTKLRIVESMGGNCVCCGYNKCIASLALHHLDPNEKDIRISNFTANPKSWNKIVSELRKCILVCHNCHSEIHSAFASIPENVKRFDEKFADYKTLMSEKLLDNCPICGKQKRIHMRFCSNSCSARNRHVVDWDNLNLLELLLNSSIYKLSEKLGCSDGAIHKRLKKLNNLAVINFMEFDIDACLKEKDEIFEIMSAWNVGLNDISASVKIENIKSIVCLSETLCNNLHIKNNKNYLEILKNIYFDKIKNINLAKLIVNNKTVLIQKDGRVDYYYRPKENGKDNLLLIGSANTSEYFNKHKDNMILDMKKSVVYGDSMCYYFNAYVEFEDDINKIEVGIDSKCNGVNLKEYKINIQKYDHSINKQNRYKKDRIIIDFFRDNYKKLIGEINLQQIINENIKIENENYVFIPKTAENYARLIFKKM